MKFILVKQFDSKRQCGCSDDECGPREWKEFEEIEFLNIDEASLACIKFNTEQKETCDYEFCHIVSFYQFCDYVF